MNPLSLDRLWEANLCFHSTFIHLHGHSNSLLSLPTWILFAVIFSLMSGQEYCYAALGHKLNFRVGGFWMGSALLVIPWLESEASI